MRPVLFCFLLAAGGLRCALAVDLSLAPDLGKSVRVVMPKAIKQGQTALVRLTSGTISLKSGTREFQGGTVGGTAEIQVPASGTEQEVTFGERKAFTLLLTPKKNADGRLVVVEKGGGPDRGDLAVGTYTLGSSAQGIQEIDLTFSSKISPPKDWTAPSLPFGPVNMKAYFRETSIAGLTDVRIIANKTGTDYLLTLTGAQKGSVGWMRTAPAAGDLGEVLDTSADTQVTVGKGLTYLVFKRVGTLPYQGYELDFTLQPLKSAEPGKVAFHVGSLFREPRVEISKVTLDGKPVTKNGTSFGPGNVALLALTKGPDAGRQEDSMFIRIGW